MNRDCRRLRPLITRHLDRELAEPEVRALDVHLAACAECRAELEALGTLRAAARQVRAPGPRPDESARILAAASPLLERHARAIGRPARLPLLWPDDLVTAGALAASFFLLFVLVQERKGTEPGARGVGSSPVYTLEERQARDSGTPLDRGETIHLEGLS